MHSANIKYEPLLKNFFLNFHKKIDGSSRCSKKGAQSVLVSDDRTFILTYLNRDVYFYCDGESTLLQIKDLKSLHRAMDKYLDEQYQEFLNGNLHNGGRVPTFYI